MKMFVNYNYLKNAFYFLNRTEGYGTIYQYAYMISCILFNEDIRCTNYFVNHLTIEQIDKLDDYVMDNNFDGFVSYIEANFNINKKEILK